MLVDIFILFIGIVLGVMGFFALLVGGLILTSIVKHKILKLPNREDHLDERELPLSGCNCQKCCYYRLGQSVSLSKLPPLKKPKK